jgi:hypothetical protein
MALGLQGIGATRRASKLSLALQEEGRGAKRSEKKRRGPDLIRLMTIPDWGEGWSLTGK